MPAKYKTVQARILGYAQELGWTYVPRGEATQRRGFDHSRGTPAEQAAEASPYFDDLLHAQVRKLNPKYAEGGRRSGASVNCWKQFRLAPFLRSFSAHSTPFPTFPFFLT